MSESETTARKTSLDRELYCPQLQRLLMSAASELGLHGANFERSGGSTEDPNYAMLRRIGIPNDIDKHGRVHRRQIVGPLVALEKRWRQLSRSDQATALAHYLGTPRAHETLRSQFGELAGVVLHRWLTKQAKGRDRLARVGTEKAQARLAEIREKLLPLELELSRLARLNRRPLRIEEPETEPEDVEQARVERRHREACRAVLRFLAGLRNADIARRTTEAECAAKPLRDEAATLCAQESACYGAGDAGDDEAALLDACGRGGEKKKRADLLPGGENDLTTGATSDVKALHRAWFATGRAQAKAWVLGDEEAA
ncbi:hypothetical protein [Caudoviricetes sp.]|nr:hypothetical protein [Caudoviricetes sp.]